LLTPLTSNLAAGANRWRALASTSPLALLVDLDGTLIPFANTPEEAHLDADTIATLNRLVELSVNVVIVSGRSSELIDGMRPLVPGAWWVAEHGSWRWAPTLTAMPATHAPELDTLMSRLEAVLRTPGTRVERKSLSLCLHWRLVAEELRAETITSIEMICDEWLEEHPRFERLGGVEILEIRERGVSKGQVVGWVRDRIRGVRIIAMGDDVTDQDMFAELDDDDGSISVGPRISEADAHAHGVADARAFLHWLAEARTGNDLPLPIVSATTTPIRKRFRLLVMSNGAPAFVSALEPALRDERGVWLGWSGQERSHVPKVQIDMATEPARARFDLPQAVREQFYDGFCNRVLWPLMHGFPNRVRCTDGDFEAYVRANERYARHAIEISQRDATIWVHDFHLLLAARALRALGHEGRIGLFLHVPFPSREVWQSIPWGDELVDAMLDFDLVGFQTQQYATSFLACAHGAKSERKRTVEVGVFPATIDPHEFREPAEESREVMGLRDSLLGKRLVLGVDRLDYAKGIPERLDAYERMLERYPHWQRRVSFLQISVPTRAEIPDYAELRERVEGLVGRINGRFGDTDWVPVRYLYRSYDHSVLAQLYRLADVALVTPLRDGMNLVAKEFIAAQNPETPGVLVLSQYTGAAETLTAALLANPFHPEGLAADIEHALAMPIAERKHRHRMLLGALEREGDAKLWAQRFLARLAPRRLRVTEDR
jgi:trehalose 6-phosphate synthase